MSVSLSFVTNGAEVPAAGFRPACFPSSLLFFFSLSLLLCAGPIFLWKTYIASYGIYLNLHALTRTLKSLFGAVPAENKRLLLLLG